MRFSPLCFQGQKERVARTDSEEEAKRQTPATVMGVDWLISLRSCSRALLALQSVSLSLFLPSLFELTLRPENQSELSYTRRLCLLTPVVEKENISVGLPNQAGIE